jgi:hypothetical protein
MHIEGGKSIKEFSIYAGEDEILLEPYTQFKVFSVESKKV